MSIALTTMFQPIPAFKIINDSLRRCRPVFSHEISKDSIGVWIVFEPDPKVVQFFIGIRRSYL